MDLDTGVVIAVCLAALAYVFARARKSLRGGDSCGCGGCEGCDGPRTPSTKESPFAPQAGPASPSGCRNCPDRSGCGDTTT